jgi:hypothetical protein
MDFDIYQRVMEGDEYLEDVASAYRERLMEQFVASPEAQELLEQQSTLGWAEAFMDYGMGYLGVTPAQMTPEDVSTVLFELFPRKVSAAPGSAREIVPELRAFWQFLGRAFALPTAAACLRLLDDRAARRLEREMANPANFGLAKGFFMQGVARGFDMTTQEGLDAWTTTYNAEAAARHAAGSAPLPLNTGGPFLAFPPAPRRAKKASAARKRKQAHESRKTNRQKNRQPS